MLLLLHLCSVRTPQTIEQLDAAAYQLMRESYGEPEPTPDAKRVTITRDLERLATCGFVIDCDTHGTTSAEKRREVDTATREVSDGTSAAGATATAGAPAHTYVLNREQTFMPQPLRAAELTSMALAPLLTRADVPFKPLLARALCRMYPVFPSTHEGSVYPMAASARYEETFLKAHLAGNMVVGTYESTSGNSKEHAVLPLSFFGYNKHVYMRAYCLDSALQNPKTPLEELPQRTYRLDRFVSAQEKPLPKALQSKREQLVNAAGSAATYTASLLPFQVGNHSPLPTTFYVPPSIQLDTLPLSLITSLENPTSRLVPTTVTNKKRFPLWAYAHGVIPSDNQEFFDAWHALVEQNTQEEAFYTPLKSIAPKLNCERAHIRHFANTIAARTGRQDSTPLLLARIFCVLATQQNPPHDRIELDLFTVQQRLGLPARAIPALEDSLLFYAAHGACSAINSIFYEVSFGGRRHVSEPSAIYPERDENSPLPQTPRMYLPQEERNALAYALQLVGISPSDPFYQGLLLALTAPQDRPQHQQAAVPQELTPPKELQTLFTIYDALDAGDQLLCGEYSSRKNPEPHVKVVLPLELTHTQDRWYLMCFEPQTQFKQTLRLNAFTNITTHTLSPKAYRAIQDQRYRAQKYREEETSVSMVTLIFKNREAYESLWWPNATNLIPLKGGALYLELPWYQTNDWLPRRIAALAGDVTTTSPELAAATKELISTYKSQVKDLIKQMEAAKLSNPATV
jgi:predicted DNA-binding transcriptional regulator YafY